MSEIIVQLVVGFALFLVIMFWYLVVRNESSKSDKIFMGCLFLLVILGMAFETIKYLVQEYIPWENSGNIRYILEVINRTAIVNGLFIATFVALNINSSKNEERLEKITFEPGKRAKFVEKSDVFVKWIMMIICVSIVLGLVAFLEDKYFLAGIGGLVDGDYTIARIIPDLICLLLLPVFTFSFVKRPKLRERCMVVWLIEIAALIIRLPVFDTMMYSFTNLLVLICILWGHLDLTDIMKNTPFEKPGKLDFERALFNMYDRKIPFYILVASFDRRPESIERTKIITRFERKLHEIAPFVAHTSKDMFFVTEHNNIVAIIPKRGVGITGMISKFLVKIYRRESIEDRIEQACNELMESTTLTKKIKTRILLADPAIENKNEKLSFEILKKLVHSFSVYNQGTEFSAAGIYRLDDYRFNMLRMVVLDVLLDWLAENDRFEVYYQPIFSVMDFEFSSVEALVRLPDFTDDMLDKLEYSLFKELTKEYDEQGLFDPDRYAVKQTDKIVALVQEYVKETKDLKEKTSPAEFVPIIESKKKIHLLGRTVLRQVCEDLAYASDIYDYIKYIEVNMSRSQCETENIYEDFDGIISSHNLARHKFNFELTESIDVGSEKVMETINQFRNGGYKFSLDDFGTGYSNLVKVFEETYSIIKIDKSLLDACLTGNGENSNMDFFVDLLGAIASLKKAIVLEGVSDIERSAKLIGMLPDIGSKGAKGYFFQGFYFSEPLQFAEYVEFVKCWIKIRNEMTGDSLNDFEAGSEKYTNEKEKIMTSFLREQENRKKATVKTIKVIKKAV